jgi:hypothetical protein
MPPRLEQQRILSINLEENKGEFENLGLSESSMNTHKIGTIIAKRLCTEVPIREIAMYELDRPEGDQGFISAHKSLSYSILRIAALKSNPRLNFEDEDLEAVDFGAVDQTKLEEVLEEVYQFIENEKISVYNALREKGPFEAGYEEIVETVSDSSQKMHIAHRSTREVLYRCLQQGRTKDLTSGLWKIQARLKIKEALEERIKEIR